MVGLDLVLGLSMVRRCSLNLSFKRRRIFERLNDRFNEHFYSTPSKILPALYWSLLLYFYFSKRKDAKNKKIEQLCHKACNFL